MMSVEFVYGLFVINLDRQGNILCLMWEILFVACLIFIQARRNPVGILHDISGIVPFRCVAIFVDECLGSCVFAHGITDVEVAIAECLMMQSVVHPIPIATECAYYNFLVVSSKIFVKGIFSFGLQSETVGVDELYDVIVFEFGQ